MPGVLTFPRYTCLDVVCVLQISYRLLVTSVPLSEVFPLGKKVMQILEI